MRSLRSCSGWPARNAASPPAASSTSPAAAPPTDRVSNDMTNEDLGYLPATQLAELIRTKKLSPVEYMQALLARIKTLEPKVNAFVHLAEEQALAAAKQAEQALSSGARIGRLHGVPVTIKDLAAAGGMPMQSGSHIFKG